MAERHSSYEREEGDAYYTPAWVTDALLARETFSARVWECAPGVGSTMAGDIARHGYCVTADYQADFLAQTEPWAESIITNPPYKSADQFVRHALKLTKQVNGKVAMLLPLAFDSAKSRVDIFRDCGVFSAKLVLLKRIRWDNLVQKAAGPSMNHAWYVWDWGNDKQPRCGWL
jgi:hypothetical protein